MCICVCVRVRVCICGERVCREIIIIYENKINFEYNIFFVEIVNLSIGL